MGKIGDEILNRLKNEKSELQQIDERLNTISTKTVPIKNNYSKATREELISERKSLQNKINNYKRKEKRSWWDKDDNLLENVGNVLYKTFLENQDEKYVKDKKYDDLVSKYDAVNKQLAEVNLKNKKYGNGFKGFVEKSNDVIVGNVKSAEKGITSTASKLLGHTPTEEQINQHQYEKYAQKALENSSGIEKVALDIQGNLARMVPQMAMPGKKSAIVTGFANYGGGAYNEARREGKSDADATKYGIAIGTLEMGLQKVLGGLNNVYGKSALGNVTSKVMGNVVKNKAVRDTLASMTSEGIEEYVQDIINPVVRNITMNENNKFKPFTEEALYSGIMGALTSGLLDGTVNAVNSSRIANNSKTNLINTAQSTKLNTDLKNGNIVYDIDKDITKKRVTSPTLQLRKSGNSFDNNISQNDISVKSDTLSLNNMQSNNKIIPIKGNESKFYDNVTEKSKYLSNDLREVLKNESDIKYYEKITNEETLEKASKRLKDGGKSEVYDWLKRNNPDSIDKSLVKRVKNIDAVDVAEGWILLKQFQEQGDYQSAVNVAKTMRNMGTRAGQAIQAYNIMERLTPNGMIYYVQSELSEAYNQMVKDKSKSWIDKNIEKFDLTPEETQFIVKTMEELKNITDERQRKVKLGTIQKLVTDKIPPVQGQGIKSWMRISMLFNPKTQVRNVMGNALIAPVNTVSDVFSSVIDKQIAKKTGVRTTGTTKIKNYVQGFKKGAFESYDDFKRGINTRNVQGDRFEIGQGNSFNNNNFLGKKLNTLDKTLSFVLDVGDRTFYEATFVNSINNQLVLNNTSDVTPEMIDIATTEALQRTWQDNNNYTKAVLEIRRAMNKLNVSGYGLGDVIIPFAKTPANLTKAIVDYSPIGLTKAVSLDAKKFVNSLENGQYSPQLQHQFVQNLGKGMAGSFLYVLGFALAKAGITSGDNDDDKDVSNFMRNTLGIQPYSIKIGNKTFAYDWAQPIATPFAITANFVKQSKENPDATIIEKAINALNIGTEQLLQQSFLESLNTVLNGQGKTLENLSEAVLELPSRAVPTLLKQIADMVDGTQRTSYEYKNPVKTSVNKVVSKIPFASKTLAPTKDTLGRDIKKYGGKNNFFNVFLNPANVSTENISESAEEIYKIYKETGDATILPRVAPYYIKSDGEQVVLTSEEKSEFQEISGEIIDNNVKKLLDNTMYNELSDTEKSEIISNIVNFSYNKARKEVLHIDMSSTYEKADKYIQNGGEITNYYLVKNNLNLIKSDKNEDGNSVNGSASGKKAYYIMNNDDLSDVEKSYLIDDMTDQSVNSSDLKKLTNDESVYKYYFSLNHEQRDEYKRLISGCDINQLEYIKFKQQSFEADKYPNGKTISGSKKRKVINYVNSLSLSIPQKAMLIKSEYNSFDSYNRQIVQYVNNQKLSKEEKIAILEDLGFKIVDGKIYG